MKHRKGIRLIEQEGDPEQTLGGLAEWYQLEAQCGACWHTKPIDRYELARRYGKGTRISGIASRLRCQKCGNREGNRVLIGMRPRE